MVKPYPCKLCNTPNQLEEEGAFLICQVCGWEDDPLQKIRPHEIGPNKISYSEGRIRWQNGETLFEKYPNPKRKTKAA